MTIERPMCPPPLADNVALFSQRSGPRTKPALPSRRIDAGPSDGAPSTTGKNKRLRDLRRDIWRCAEAATRYWKVRLDFEDALSYAQSVEVPEGDYHPIVNSKDRHPMVGRYREALVKQLLTPASDVAAVNWKRAALARGQHRHTDVKAERIERAIADDVAWLAAHPFRIKPRVAKPC